MEKSITLSLYILEATCTGQHSCQEAVTDQEITSCYRPDTFLCFCALDTTYSEGKELLSMADPRHRKLAQVLIHYSLRLKAGEKFLIGGPDIATPLIQEVYREAVRIGAYVTTQIDLDGLREIYMRESSEEQLQHISELDKYMNEYFDAQLYILGERNTKALSNI